MTGKHRSDGDFIAAMSLAIAFGVSGCNRDPPPTQAAAEATTAARPELKSTPTAPVPVAETEPSADMRGMDSQMAMMDMDGDGRITPAEHAAAASSKFSTMDTNQDRSVTAVEMDAAQQALGGDPRMSSVDKIKAIDGNGDGMLSAVEHAAGSRSMFAKMDSDHDGDIRAAELQAGHDAMMGG